MLNCSPICEGCPAQLWGEKRVEPDGYGTNGILIVGEGPWQDEIRAGRNFSGAAGSLLERCLRRLGQERSQFTIANATWCRTKFLGFFDKPTPLAVEVMNHCRPHLDQLIEQRKPKVIVALGGTALERICGVRGITNRHGYVMDSPYGIPVIASFHPSFIMQGNQKYQGVLMFALKRALEVAKGSWERSPVNYILDDWERMELYLERPSPLLVVDIETPKSSKLDEENVDEEDQSYAIIRASLSTAPGSAVSFPWTEPFISLARQACSMAEVVVMHNAGFDRPRLEQQGFQFREVHDSMWSWHFLQSDLPKGLGFVAPFYYDGQPWKHLAEAQPDWYSAVDADATMRVYLGVKRDLQAQGRWERWLKHCVQVSPLLAKMGRAGILVDRERQASLRERLQAEYDVALAKLQTEVPEGVRPVKRWKRPHEGAAEVKVPCSCTVDLDNIELGGSNEQS